MASGWRHGAGVVYEPLAAALVSACPIPLPGIRLLDAGSGAGAVAGRAAAGGATVVAADLSAPMMAATPGGRCRQVVADVRALPFGTATFDVAAAAFVLNHIDPADGFRELARTVRRGGVVLASSWLNGDDPVKAATDGVLDRWGWVAPGWYRQLKDVYMVVAGDPARLASAAGAAGLVSVETWVHAEDLGVRDPAAVVDYRLSMAHVAGWAVTLDDAARARLAAEVAAAVAPLLSQWRPAALFLRARTAD